MGSDKTNAQPMKPAKLELTDWSSVIPRLLILLGLICLFFFWLFYSEFGTSLFLNEVILLSVISVLILHINSFYRVFFDDNAIYLRKYFFHKNKVTKIEYESITAFVAQRAFPPSFSYMEYNDGDGNINSIKLKISSGGWINFSKQLKKRGLLEKIPTRHTI
jgi:hypothetical protein